MSRAIMQQALTALNTCDWDYDSEEEPYKTFDEDLVNAAAAALKEALAEPEQEPTLFFGRAVYFADPRTGEILPPPDLSIEANRVAYDVAMHYANKTKEQLAKIRANDERIKELEDAEISRRYTEALAQGWKECFDRAAAVTLQAAFEKQAKEKK